MEFHVPTLLASLALLLLFSAGIIFYLSRMQYDVRGPKAWCAGAVLLGVGLGLSFVRGRLPDWVSFVLGNLLVVYGHALNWTGFRLILGRRALVLPTLLIPLAPLPVFAWFLYFSPSLAMRGSIIALVMALFTGLSGWELLRGKRPLGRPQTFAGVIFTAQALSYILFSVLYHVLDITEDLFTSGPLITVMLFSGEFFCVAFLAAVTLLVNETLKKRWAGASQEAQRANKAKSDFLANMSHEMRTPLNVSLGMLQLLQASELNPEQREQVNLAAASTRDMRLLIDDLLDISRVEAGKIELRETVDDPTGVLSEAVRPFKAQAKAKGLIFVSRMDELPELLKGDFHKLKQVAVNLVDNAVKFTSKGQVRVHVFQRRQGDPGKVMLCLDVQDTGPGIEPEKQARIFDPFYQGQPSGMFGGTGLGLAICKRIVQRMGGAMTVHSRPGRGSHFQLEVPLTLPSEAEAVLARRADTQDSRSLENIASLPPMHILLVEDFELNRRFTSKLLTRKGHTVRMAENGAEAVAMAARERFDLVLMDVRMPDMDGVEATRRIRALPDTRAAAVPIVAFTALALAGDRERFLEAGMDDYLAKPLDLRELHRIMAAYAPRAGNATPRRPDRFAAPTPAAPQAPAAQAAPGKGSALANGNAAADSAQPAEPLDMSKVLRMLGGNPEDLAEFLNAVRDLLPGELGRLKDAVARWDGPACMRLSHSLKSTAEAFGQERLKQLLRSMEAAGSDSDRQRALALMDQVEQGVTSLVQRIGQARS